MEKNIIEDYVNRMKITEICKKYSISITKLRAVRKKYNIKRRGSIANDFSEQILNYFHEGIPYKQISNNLGISEYVLNEFLSKKGLTHSRPNPSHTYFKLYRTGDFTKLLNNSKESAYWLGFLTAKGSLFEKNRIIFNLKENYQDVLDNFVKYFKLEVPILKRANNTINLSISFPELHKFLVNFRKTYVNFYNKNMNHKNEFLCGYIAARGHSNYGKSFCISGKNKFLKKIKKDLYVNGIRDTSIYETGNPSDILRINKSDVEKFFEFYYTYSKIELPQKIKNNTT